MGIGIFQKKLHMKPQCREGREKKWEETEAYRMITLAGESLSEWGVHKHKTDHCLCLCFECKENILSLSPSVTKILSQITHRQKSNVFLCFRSVPVTQRFFSAHLEADLCEYSFWDGLRSLKLPRRKKGSQEAWGSIRIIFSLLERWKNLPDTWVSS